MKQNYLERSYKDDRAKLSSAVADDIQRCGGHKLFWEVQIGH